MPKIKVDHVVTFSSEDNVHVATNILTNDMTKKWKTKGTGEPFANIILHLDRVTKISGVDICNESSAFVEVLVGRSSSQGEEYQPLVIMSSFMSPMESRELRETNRVRIFSYKDLVADIRDEKWDRVKFNCTQPFNKNIQYGLSSITLYSPQEEKKDDFKAVSLGKFTLRPESPVNLNPGSLFSKRTEKKESLSEQIRKITSKEYIDKTASPKCTTAKITPKNSPKPPSASSNKVPTSKNRNSIDLFYESDDDKKTDKIDRLIAHQKQEEQKKKATLSEQSSSTKKRTIDKVEKTPKKVEKEDKRKPDVEPKVKKQCLKKDVIKKPFNKLLNGVVFTISGFINPERGNLREKALELGAKYKPNWDNHCTHLICAFANTPKFREVQGKGKIIKKNWIYDCHSQRKRLPWRRYALDSNDEKSESEDEIHAEKNTSDDEAATPEIADISGSDTEDEIEKIQKRQRALNNKDEESPYDRDTDEESISRISTPIGDDLSRIFNMEMFYVDVNAFSVLERSRLQTKIRIINGLVLAQPSHAARYIITTEEHAQEIKKRFSGATVASAAWIYEMYNTQSYQPVGLYTLA